MMIFNILIVMLVQIMIGVIFGKIAGYVGSKIDFVGKFIKIKRYYFKIKTFDKKLS